MLIKLLKALFLQTQAFICAFVFTKWQFFIINATDRTKTVFARRVVSGNTQYQLEKKYHLDNHYTIDLLLCQRQNGVFG